MARCVLGRFGALYVFIGSIVWLAHCTLVTEAGHGHGGHHGGHHGGAARHGGGGWRRQQPRWQPRKQQQHWHQQKRASSDYWRRYSKPHGKQWWAPHHATAKHAPNKQWHQQQKHWQQQQKHWQRQNWQQQHKQQEQKHWQQQHWKDQHWNKHAQKRATSDYWRRHSKPHSQQWWVPRHVTYNPEASCPTHHYQGQCMRRQGCLWCYNRFSFWPGSNGVCIAERKKWQLPSWVYVCTYHW